MFSWLLAYCYCVLGGFSVISMLLCSCYCVLSGFSIASMLQSSSYGIWGGCLSLLLLRFGWILILACCYAVTGDLVG